MHPRELRTLLAEDELGGWALDAETIEFLWTVVRRLKPRLLIECGAGLSTLMLGAYAASAAQGGNSPHLISLEQDEGHLVRTMERITRARLESFVTLIHAPLNLRGTYSLDPLRALDRLRHESAGFILIDGPSVPDSADERSGTRAYTLPELVPLCQDRATWFLDDAFRDHELSVLRQWRRQPSIRVEGIYPIGKGVAAGTIHR